MGTFTIEKEFDSLPTNDRQKLLKDFGAGTILNAGTIAGKGIANVDHEIISTDVENGRLVLQVCQVNEKPSLRMSNCVPMYDFN